MLYLRRVRQRKSIIAGANLRQRASTFQKPRAFTPSSAAGGTRPVLEHG